MTEGELAWIIVALGVLAYEIIQWRRRRTTITRMVKKYVATNRPGAYILGGLLGWLPYHFMFDDGALGRWDVVAALAGAGIIGELGFRFQRFLERPWADLDLLHRPHRNGGPE